MKKVKECYELENGESIFIQKTEESGYEPKYSAEPLTHYSTFRTLKEAEAEAEIIYKDICFAIKQNKQKKKQIIVNRCLNAIIVILSIALLLTVTISSAFVLSYLLF